jgi:hypothetical protein
MSNTTEKWEEDAEWLRRNFPLRASEDDVDAFCERVAIKTANGMGEASARFSALAEMRARHER